MQDGRRTSAVKQFLQNKWVRLIVVIDILVVITVVGVIIWNSAKTATINLNIAPIDAVVQIDGHGEYRNGTYKVHPGNHEITISREGLNPKTFSIDAQNGYVTTLTAFLSGDNGDFSFYELKDNYASFQKLAEIASASNNITTDHDTSAETFIANFRQQYDLYQTALPINYHEYEYKNGERSLAFDITIKANNEDICTKTLCIKALMALTDDKSTIDKLLRERGFKPEDLEIEYQVY